jgi:hypothetical protein
MTSPARTADNSELPKNDDDDNGSTPLQDFYYYYLQLYCTWTRSRSRSIRAGLLDSQVRTICSRSSGVEVLRFYCGSIRQHSSTVVLTWNVEKKSDGK